MSRKPVVLAIVGILLLGGVFIFSKYFTAIRAPFFPAPEDITDRLLEDNVPPGAINETNMPLKIPNGFSISIFAKDLPGARVMAFDNFNNMWVSQTSENKVSLLEINKDTGTVKHQGALLMDFQKPHGLAFDPTHPGLLYIAGETKIRRITTYSDDPGEDVMTLPGGGGHFTRTIGFGPDNRLYISIGSSCNVCRESEEKRATIQVYDPATKQISRFAHGLRNSVFFIWDSAGKMWATDMGRDWLGDNTPPDEVNVIVKDGNYGWPNCYGKNIHDTDFDKNTYIRNPCMEPFEKESFIDVPAHSAPLGLAFIPANSSWPKEYWNNLLVSYHGSWNRKEPTGYKVVRHKFDEEGNYLGVEDFITGWLTPQGALGRPVDIVVKVDGTMYLSDDKAGVIYKIQVTK